MQFNRKQNIEINLKDIFFYILCHWRSVLVVALIGAVALCSYQYLSIKYIHDKGRLTKEERQYKLDIQKYQDDLEKNENIIRVNTKLLQGQNAYQRKSIYFQLDAQKVWTASKQYLVKVDQSVLDNLPQGSSIDPNDSVLSAYTAPLSEATEDELKESFGTDEPEYVNELVSTWANVADNTIKVSVKSATREMALTGIELLHRKIEGLASGKAQEIDKHKLLLINESVNQGPDENLSKKQEEIAETITNLQESLQKARQELDDIQAKDEIKEPNMHLVKMAIIGFVLGTVLIVFIYALLYVTKGKLNISRDLAERYKIPVFGELLTSHRFHSDKGLDKLFSKWELSNKSLDTETVYDNIAALIDEKQGVKSVFLASTLPMEKLITVKEGLAKRLPEKAIGVQADLNHNSDGITKAAKADAVILVEGKGISDLKDIDRMAENLIIVEANVIGAIIL